VACCLQRCKPKAKVGRYPRYDGKTYTFRVGTEDQHYVNAIEDGTVIIYFRNDGSDRPLCSNPIGITVSGGSLDGQVHMNLAPGRSWRIPVGVHKGGEIYVTIHNGYVDQGDNWTATIYEMCVGFSWN